MSNNFLPQTLIWKPKVDEDFFPRGEKPLDEMLVQSLPTLGIILWKQNTNSPQCDYFCCSEHWELGRVRTPLTRVILCRFWPLQRALAAHISPFGCRKIPWKIKRKNWFSSSCRDKTLAPLLKNFNTCPYWLYCVSVARAKKYEGAFVTWWHLSGSCAILKNTHFLTAIVLYFVS